MGANFALLGALGQSWGALGLPKFPDFCKNPQKNCKCAIFGDLGLLLGLPRAIIPRFSTLRGPILALWGEIFANILLLAALWTLMGCSLDTLGTLLDTLALLAALGILLRHSWLDLRTSKTRFRVLRSYFKRLLSNPSARLAARYLQNARTMSRKKAARYLQNACTMSRKKTRSHSEQPKRMNSL